MKNTLCGVIFLFSLTFYSVSHAQPSYPDYHTDTYFLLSSPVALGNGLMGTVNPAMVNTIHGMDLHFYFSNKDSKWSSPEKWGLYMGIPHLGFGMTRQKGMDNYRISLGFGNPNSGVGLGYGWYKVSLKSVQRDPFWMAGFLSRPNRYLSVGLITAITPRNQSRSGIFDLALRPFGSDLITLFGDVSWKKKSQFKDGLWSFGVALQPLPGIHLTGRLFDSEMISVGLSFSFGGCGLSAQTHIDENRALSTRTTHIRFGTPTPNIFDTYLKKNCLYLSMDFKGKIGYRKYMLFDEGKHTLTEILASLEDGLNDFRVKGVAINLSGMQCDHELAWEIREKLYEWEKSGKRVIVFLDRGSMTEYHLASIANVIVMDPEGILELGGYVMGRTYIKGLLKKIGLGFDEWRFMKYKSAAEVLSRDNMSDPDREQRKRLLDNLYHLVRNDICLSRSFTETFFDSLINEQFIFLSDDGLQTGLIDTIGRWSNIEEIIKSYEGQKRKMIGSDGLIKRIYPRRKWGAKPRIAVIYALGLCAMENGIKARELEKIILKVAKEPRIQAVVLRVDSPGGEGLASDLVAEAMRKCQEKKPVIVSQGYVAASGGYHISMNADTIVAAPHTITGSIGVIGGWLWNEDMGEKIGLSFDHVKVGKHSDLASGLRLPFIKGPYIPDRNLNEEEHLKVKVLMDKFYKGFIQKVAQSRNMKIETVEEIGEGRVWSGIDGKENGLVDLLGGLETAISVAKQKAGIPIEQEIDLVEMPKKGWINPDALSLKLFGVKVKDHDPDPIMDYIRVIGQNPGKPLPLLSPDLYRIQ